MSLFLYKIEFHGCDKRYQFQKPGKLVQAPQTFLQVYVYFLTYRNSTRPKYLDAAVSLLLPLDLCKQDFMTYFSHSSTLPFPGSFKTVVLSDVMLSFPSWHRAALLGLETAVPELVQLLRHTEPQRITRLGAEDRYKWGVK